MNPQRKRRMWFVVIILLGVGAAAALALTAFQENILYFFSPTQVADGEAPTSRSFRVGGLVTSGSVVRDADGVTVHFEVTDTAHSLKIKYAGILPDLFREGQGIVAIGRLRPDGVFDAETVLAKHDENYMPPEVADSLKKAGAVPPVDSVHMKNAAKTVQEP